MFIFISAPICSNQPGNRIYIPLCLYLYAVCYCTLYTISKIYIPLCLYLYLCLVICQCPFLYLHSTMFIFICLPSFSLLSLVFIYIPLCLYLYVFSVMLVKEFLLIYIPLCLYLYKVYPKAHIEPTRFTFHYVYIYIYMQPGRYAII